MKLKIREQLDALLVSRRVLIAAHRAMGCGNVMENTFRGCLASWRNGADMVEVDVVKSTDDVFYTLHDGMELLLLAQAGNLGEISSEEIDNRNYVNINYVPTGKVERLFDLLAALKGKGIINIDRSWRYWGDGFLKRLIELEMPDQLLLKCPAADEDALAQLMHCSVPFMFMPIVSTVAELETVRRLGLNLVAAECIFPSDDHELLESSYHQELKRDHIYLWANAITLGGGTKLAGDHDDDGAVFASADDNWGWLIDRNFDILQTDWPGLLHAYLSCRFPGSRKALS